MTTAMRWATIGYPPHHPSMHHIRQKRNQDQKIIHQPSRLGSKKAGKRVVKEIDWGANCPRGKTFSIQRLIVNF